MKIYRIIENAMKNIIKMEKINMKWSENEKGSINRESNNILD